MTETTGTSELQCGVIQPDRVKAKGRWDEITTKENVYCLMLGGGQRLAECGSEFPNELRVRRRRIDHRPKLLHEDGLRLLGGVRLPWFRS